VAQVLRADDPDGEVVVVGRTGGVAERLVSDAGLRLETLQISGVDVSSPRSVVRAASQLPRATLAARALLRRTGADVVAGTGGYVCLPVVMAALSRGIPVVLMEQNAYPGRTTRLLARRARAVAVSFDSTARMLGGAKVVVTGNPLRREVLDRLGAPLGDACCAFGPPELKRFYDAATSFDGRGQTIAVVGLYAWNPADLAVFDRRFGLPPLPAGSIQVCTGTSSRAPGCLYSAGSTEISLDVQYAHATAPRARIINYMAASASLADFAVLYNTVVAGGGPPVGGPGGVAFAVTRGNTGYRSVGVESVEVVRPDGTVTAGNSSGVNDGACALLLASERAATRHGLTPRARVVGMATIGVAPRIMGIGPEPATRRVLELVGLSLKQIDVIELNEAFAAQGLAVLRRLGLADDDPRVNPNGGAIALGHPLGASGARLVTTAVNQLQRSGGRYALCTMCVGVGQGIAVVVERL